MSFFFYDPLVADALVQRFPVPGASTADRAAAAKKLRDRGFEIEYIAMILGVNKRTVQRYIYSTDVAPMPPIAEWTNQSWPVCPQGEHEMSPDNVMVNKRCKACHRKTRDSSIH
jgi:hypothetical protein